MRARGEEKHEEKRVKSRREGGRGPTVTERKGIRKEEELRRKEEHWSGNWKVKKKREKRRII